MILIVKLICSGELQNLSFTGVFKVKITVLKNIQAMTDN